MKLLTSILVLAMYIFVMAVFGNISIFIDISSIIVVIIPTIIIALCKYGKELFFNLRDDMYLTIGKSALYCGLVGSLIGLILMLNSLDDPTKIGPAMAISLISTLYSSMIFLFCYSALTEKHSITSEVKIISFIYLSCGLFSFVVMLLSFTNLN